MAESNISMKLLIDTQNNRVLFAEASKDCVDFLFHMLSLPIATVIRLLKEENEMVGSVQNLYESIENLNETYIVPQHSKDFLLKLNFRACSCSVPLLSINNTPTDQKKHFYKCSGCSSYSTTRVTDDNRAICPGCSQRMTTSMTYVSPPPLVPNATNETGFVKGVVTYMVMDDLVVTPMSTISCITLLNKFNVRDVSVLQEKVVNLGMDEALKLLKASLHSKKVLTEVFVTKNEEKATVLERVQEVNDDAVKVQ
ncbi:hypothetical protein ACJIZ3_017306 [Penstemon smallii]|uniref:DUF674 domain-containing protein n=1 Tax=Penstemon smallii TaxID=265156 RepID=A0ABD3SV68_9LAMI